MTSENEFMQPSGQGFTVLYRGTVDKTRFVSTSTTKDSGDSQKGKWSP